MENKNTVILFLKNMVLGKVKTRIGKVLGHQEALEIYHSLIKITHNLLSKINSSKYIYYSNFIVQNDIWDNTQYIKKNQTGQDLGIRMFNAIEEVLQTKKQVILIGSDCPYISPQIIQKGFSILKEKDIVIGPALDGGYYLIGMKKAHLELFNNMEWSTSTVFSNTLTNIQNLSLSYGLLPKLSDIDEVEDWEKWILMQTKFSI